MKIQIKRAPIPIKQLRKAKLTILKNKKKKIFKDLGVSIKYDWKLNGEYQDESIEDFHLFCISIVRDLLGEKFNTNENGKISYEGIEQVDIEYTQQELQILYDIIANHKTNLLSNDDQI